MVQKSPEALLLTCLHVRRVQQTPAVRDVPTDEKGLGRSGFPETPLKGVPLRVYKGSFKGSFQGSIRVPLRVYKGSSKGS